GPVPPRGCSGGTRGVSLGRCVNRAPAVGTNAAIAMKRASARSPGSSEMMKATAVPVWASVGYPLASRTGPAHGSPQQRLRSPLRGGERDQLQAPAVDHIGARVEEQEDLAARGRSRG